MIGGETGAGRGQLAMVRGAMVRAIQRQIAAVGPDHPIRRLHTTLRTVPGVSFLWRRVLGAGTRDWFDIEPYRRRGGVFAPSQPGDAVATQPSRGMAGSDWAFMNQVAAAAVACEPTYQPVDGRAVLVNCSLAAGGAERQIVATLTALKTRGYSPIFIGEFIQSGNAALDFYQPTLQQVGIQVERADPGPLPGPAFYADVTQPVATALSQFEPEPVTRLLGMVRHLRRLRPAVVHLWQDQTSVLHGLAALIARVPRIVLSGRNIDPTHFAYFRPWLHPGYHVLAAQPHVVLTNNSQAGADAYTRWLGLEPHRIGVILNAAQLPPLLTPDERAAARMRMGLGDDELLVAGVLRMSAEKQPLLWVETAAALAQQEPRARFQVAGDGPLMAQVATRASALGLADRIRFLGEITDVHSLQGAADVLLLTSAQEGTPNVLLEAQALNTPVVTTDAGGAAACVLPGRTGFVVPCADATPQTLSQAIVQATALGAEMRQNDTGRRHIEASFAEERMIMATLQAYGFALDDSNKRSQTANPSEPARDQQYGT